MAVQGSSATSTQEIGKLLLHARDALRQSPTEAMKELGEEVDDILRRYLAERGADGE